MKHLPLAIRESTWGSLVYAAKTSVAAGWATPGVFATAIGPDYRPGSADAVFYVGKSGGPLVDSVGLCDEQAASSAASTTWMVERKNPSAFWVFADLIARRESMAWSNVSKIDTRHDGPPGMKQWSSIKSVCLKALAEELEYLSPGKTVFAVSSYQTDSIRGVLRALGFVEQHVQPELDSSTVFADVSGRLALITRHPQGWRREPRNMVASFIREWPVHEGGQATAIRIAS